MRADLEIIQEWDSRRQPRLDLGCGDGELPGLAARPQAGQRLRPEIDPDNIARCIENG